MAAYDFGGRRTPLGRDRARKLRSLAKGDVVRIDGTGYTCESVNWKQRGDSEPKVPSEFDAVEWYGAG